MLATRPLVLSAVAGTVLLAALFFSVLLQKDATLENSLVDMSLLPPVRYDEVLVESGTVLTGDVTARTLTAAEGPYILQGAVRIPAGVRVEIRPETALAAAEGARLVVEGTLRADGASFFSNHLHPRRQLWYGIIVDAAGTADLMNTSLANAAAALTCAAGGSLTLRGGTLTDNAAGVVALPGNRRCRIAETRIAGGRVGFHLVGGRPVIHQVTTDRVADALRVFHEAQPDIRELTIRRPIRAAMVYAATPNLTVRGLSLPSEADRDALILDGADVPTHYWNGQDYPTGRVLFR